MTSPPEAPVPLEGPSWAARGAAQPWAGLISGAFDLSEVRPGSVTAAMALLRERPAPGQGTRGTENEPRPGVARRPPPREARDIPSLAAVRPRSHVESPGWLGDAVRKLAEIDAEATARAILALLPVQGEVIESEIAYDLVVDDGLCYSVTVGRTETAIHRLPIPRPLASIDGRVDTRLGTLGNLPIASRLRSLRRSDSIRVVGRHKKQVLAALREVATAPFGLADALAIGVSFSPELLLALVACGITPDWTIGHRFTIAFEVGDRHVGEPLFLRVNDGSQAALSRGLPLDLPSATVTCRPEQLADVLLGRAVSDAAQLAGERAPLMLVQGWVARLESGRG